jgi:aromatic-L-amino-acid/L-tryptophan decarboxylase
MSAFRPKHGPISLDQVYRDYRETLAAYPMGNTHPRFWGWQMDASNITGT